MTVLRRRGGSHSGPRKSFEANKLAILQPPFPSLLFPYAYALIASGT